MLPQDILQALRDDPAQAFLGLDQQIALRRQQLDQRKDEQEEQQARQQQLDKLHDQQQARQHNQQQLLQKIAALDEQRQQAQATLGELLGEQASAEAWQQHMEAQLEQARAADADTAQRLQALRTLEHEHQQLQGAIAHWRSSHPELDDAGLDRLLAIDDVQLGELRQQLQAAEKAIEQGRVLLQEREQRLQQHAAQAHGELPVEALEQSLAELQQQLVIQEQQCAELRAQQADDQRRQQAHQALAEQIDQAYQQWQRWARLNALIGSASGDVFRKIAQGYNLDLLLHHANSQLRQLARRYRLKRGGSALDTEMGDELRSVHSLSGGETFLVSLALALGLASMASSTLRIESLFIDEGFGSLDPESLQLAMDALDGLQAQGRKVAVISHVQEMHERIPVQIKVRRQGNGLSDVEVSG